MTHNVKSEVAPLTTRSVAHVITFTAHLTNVVGVSFLLGQYVPEYSLSCHTSQPSDFNSSRWIADVCRSHLDVYEPQLNNHHSQSPSIYAFFTSFYLYDGCGTKLLEASIDLTTSFASDVLSTVATLPGGGLTTEVFDFGSLPCPPSGVEVPAGQPYRPLLAPPPFITAIPGWDPKFDDCNPGTGIDPPTAMTSMDGGLPGPVAPGGPLPRRNDDRAYPHPHLVPRAPTQTAAPA